MDNISYSLALYNGVKIQNSRTGLWSMADFTASYSKVCEISNVRQDTEILTQQKAA